MQCKLLVSSVCVLEATVVYQRCFPHRTTNRATSPESNRVNDSRGSNNGREGRGWAFPPHHGITGPIAITVLVIAAVQTTVHGIVTSTTTATIGRTPALENIISPLKFLHLRMICEIAPNAQIPGIWLDVTGLSTREVGLELLVQYIMESMTTCQKDYLDHPYILHYIVPLYNFIVGDRFVNTGENPARPTGGGCPCVERYKAK